MSTTTHPSATTAPVATAKRPVQRKSATRTSTLSAAGTLALIVLTVVYLCLELALNARVLQFVGQSFGIHELESVQVAGNVISGMGMGLLALHLMLRLRGRSQQRVGESRPDLISMVLYGLLAVSCMFTLFRAGMDQFVSERSAEFRKQALSIQLMQSATASKLVTWKSQEDPELFSSVAGKTFLAFYPFMTAARESLAQEVQPIVKYHAKQAASEQVGGISGHYETYSRAINDATRMWNLNNRLSRNKGQTLQQYLASKPAQTALRRQMRFPDSMQVPYVTTETAFRTQIYEPLLATRVQEAVSMFAAPASAFENGRPHSLAGEEAVMRVVLPPLLLLASMFGLLVHFALLVYLLSKLLLAPAQKLIQAPWMQRLSGPTLLLIPIAMVLLVWSALTLSANTMTRSEPYQDMRKYLQVDSPQNLPLTGLVDRSLHALTVGEGWIAPLGNAALQAVKRHIDG